MRKFIFFLLFFLPFLSRAQTAPDYDDCFWFGDFFIPSEEFLENTELMATCDSLDINELNLFKKQIKGEVGANLKAESLLSQTDFLISKTRTRNGSSSNLGISFDGKIVSLPPRAIPGTLKVERQGEKIFLSWFEKDLNDNSYWLYFSELRSDLKIDSESYVSIKPVLRLKSVN